MIRPERNCVEGDGATVQREGSLGVDQDGVNTEVGGVGKSDGVGEFGGKGRGVGGRNIADIESAASEIERFANVELANVLRLLVTDRPGIM